MLPVLLHCTWRMNTASLIVLNVGYVIRYRGSWSCSLDCQMIISHVIWLDAGVDQPSACDTVWFRLLASVSEIHYAKIPTLPPLSLIWRGSFIRFCFQVQTVYHPRSFIVQFACVPARVWTVSSMQAFVFWACFCCHLTATAASLKLCPRFQWETTTGCEHNISFDGSDKAIL